MAHKKNKKQNSKRSTNTEALNPNTMSTDNQSDTTSADVKIASYPSDNNNKMLNRGCFSINKPRWFKFLSSNDRKSPIQSFLEIVIYIFVLYWCFNLFVDFYKIPQNEISIDMEKYNDSRLVTKATYDDTTYYLHYQKAALTLQMPRKDLKSEKKDIADYGGQALYDTLVSLNGKNKGIDLTCGWILGSIYEDSMKLTCLEDIHVEDNNKDLRIKTKLSDFWASVFILARKDSTIKQNFTDKRKIYPFSQTFRMFFVNDYFYNEYDSAKKLLIDSLSKEMKNFYHIKLASSDYDQNKTEEVANEWESDSLIDSTKYQKLLVDQNDTLNFNYYQYRKFRKGIESKDNKNFFFTELYHYNNLPQYIVDKYNDRNISNVILHPSLITFSNFKEDTENCSFIMGLKSDSMSNHPLSIDAPTMFDRHDISKGWYKINFKSFSIDSVSLTIRFVGATEIFPMNIEPDEKGCNYIRFNDTNKILKIIAVR